MTAAVLILAAVLLVELVLHHAEKEQWGTERAQLLNRIQAPEMAVRESVAAVEQGARWVPEDDGELALVGQVFYGENEDAKP